MAAVSDAAPRKNSAPGLSTGSSGRWSGEAPRVWRSESVSQELIVPHLHKRETSRPRKDAPRLDLSRLFTRRKSSKPSNIPNIPNIPSPLPTPSTLHEFRNSPPTQAWYQTTNAWGIRIRKPKSPNGEDILTPRLNGLEVDDVEYQSPKINIRKPPPGIQYWFDGIEDDDTASVHSEPEGRPSLSPEKSLSRSNRDTFLSISTGMTQSSTSEGGIEYPSFDQRDYFSSLGDTPRHRRHDTVSSSTPTQRRARPFSQRSHSSGATLKHVATPEHHDTFHRHHLGDSINRGQSVLVLSETDESDVDEMYHHGYPEFPGRESLEHTTQYFVPYGQLVGQRSSEERQYHMRDADQSSRRLLNVPDLISNTSIDENSQLADDDHSPRTSLLSDLRAPSFRSEYRPISFKSDRPISIQTYESEEQKAWLASPTTSSQVTHAPDLSHYLSDEYLTVPRPPTSGRSRSPPAQRLMVVTDEEATLLANMRRKRAEMDKRMTDTESEQRLPSVSSVYQSRPSTSNYSSAQSQIRTREPPAQEPPKEQSILSPTTSIASEAAMMSPVATKRPATSRPCNETISSVWEDVQGWRKRSNSPPRARRRPSMPAVVTAKPDMTCHLFPNSRSTSPHSRPSVGMHRHQSDSVANAGSNKDTRRAMDDFYIHRRRSIGLGDAMRRRVSEDVKEAVMAAWGDLGGWRRSMMSDMTETAS